MRLATPEQMLTIERACEDEQITPEVLMESAGALAAQELASSFLPELKRGYVAVVCGPGNNGGDGLVLARHLLSQGWVVKIYLLPSAQRSALFKRQLARLPKDSCIVDWDQDLMSELRSASLVVDALYGTGLSRNLEGMNFKIVEAINKCSQILSLDIPSGLSGETGEVLGISVKASMTITFGLAKLGLVVGSGPQYTGKLRVVPIGIPKNLLRMAKTFIGLDSRMAKKAFRERLPRSNKSQNGNLLVMAGHPGMWGAAHLCTSAAYRIGAGYVTLMLPPEVANRDMTQELTPEVLTISRESPELFKKRTAIVLGPGLGVNSETQKMLRLLIDKNIPRVVVDADALTALSELGDMRLPSSWVLTPHSGEMARLLGKSSDDIEKDRAQAVIQAALKYNCLVLLKGYRSLLASPSGRVVVILSGNSALAKAGTGDVLSGFIGGLMAQGASSAISAACGTYFHGWLADRWLKTGHEIRTLTPSDLLDMTPLMLKVFLEK